jgi:hypothetical protein
MSGTEEQRQTSGLPGSRDTGSDEPSGGSADRPSGAYEGDESVPTYGGEGEGPYGGTGELPPQDVKPAIPPYEGRKTHADRVGEASESVKGGEKVGGASGPVADPEYKSPAPESTPGGSTKSPADEQPASEAPETDKDPDRTGPGHVGGAGRAEEKR